MGDDIVRTGEWRQVRQFAADAAGRTAPAALAIEGEAGAGKSTLWRAGVQAAADSGCRVLRSEPSASESDLSFAGLSDLLAAVPPEAGSGIPAPQRDALEVALLLKPGGDAGPPTAHAIGLAVLAAVQVLLAAGPVAVAIDDVQWLDAASLEALTFAVRRITTGPLSLLLAARTEAPADPLTAGAPPPPHGWRDLLTAVPGAEEMMLAPLDMWQVHNLLPASVAPAQARLVARQSRGNPFWAKEIAAALNEAPGRWNPVARAPVPPLARTLTDRLARTLSPQAAEALAAVAAAGHLTMSVAAQALAHLADPAAALDAAIEAGVLTETDGRIVPAHPLIGAAAVDSLPPGRRASLYRRLAAATGPNPERYAHFVALAAGPDPAPDPQVAEALAEAAEAAHKRAANIAAGRFVAQAVLFTPESDEEALVRRRIRAGELLYLAGDMQRSLEHLETLDLDRLSTPDLERVLPLLLNLIEYLRGTAAATAMVTRAVGSARSDPHRRALVLAQAAHVVYGIPGGRRAAAIEAISCAESAGAVADGALHRALVLLFIAKVTAAEGLEVGLLDRAVRLEAGLPPPRLHDSADVHRAWSRFTEDPGTARAALQRSLVRARDRNDDLALATSLCFLATTEVLAGDYAAAAAAASEADAVAAWYDWPPHPWRLEPRCELLIRDGDLDSAARLIDQTLPDDNGAIPPRTTAQFMGACLRGKVSAWRGDHAATVRHLERAAWCADQLDWADPGVRCRLDVLLADAYVAVGRPGDARRISGWLRGLGGRLARPALTGDADRIDALLCAAAGDLEAAAGLAQAAVTAHESCPLRPELARSLLVLGQVERRRRARGQSRDALRRAHALAAEMGHRPLLAQIEQEMPLVAAARAGNELTAAERRVADLIAAGATNRDAAAALFVSVRTVETHVASIYRKLGVRSRAELVARPPVGPP